MLDYKLERLASSALNFQMQMLPKLLRKGTPIVVSLLLSSCDYQQKASGIVLDESSKQPITGVKVDKGFSYSKFNKIFQNYSDSLGHFKVHYQVVGLFKVPDLKLSFSKQGFDTNKVTLNGRTQNDTIYLKRIRGLSNSYR